MGNKANKSKDSILADTKDLLKLYDRVTWHLTNARRHHGAVKKFEDAGYEIIHCFTVAKAITGDGADEKSRRKTYIERLIGSFGEMLAAFEILMDMKVMTQKRSDKESAGEMYLFSDTAKLEIARLLERIDEGAKKWHNSIK